MRFWFSAPRVFGVRPGVSFGREDFQQQRPRQPSAEPITGSFVYVIKGGHNLIKIGVSTNPSARLATLRTISPFPLHMAFVGVTPGTGYDIEAGAHGMLAPHRCNGEWFDVSPELAISAVMGAAGKIGAPLKPLSQEQADLTLRLATGGTPIQTGDAPLSFFDYLKIAVRMSVYTLVAGIAMTTISVASVNDGNALPEWFPWVFAPVPIAALFAAIWDTKRSKRKRMAGV
jgi:hypothetical protein